MNERPSLRGKLGREAKQVEEKKKEDREVCG